VDLSINRVRGIWTQCKDLKGRYERFQDSQTSMPIGAWYERFREESNVYADQCNVLVCKTFFGADFSIDSHFHWFHTFLLTTVLTFKEVHCFRAFFLTAVLTFKEERQILAVLRLRLAVALAAGTERQSYLSVQKG
jgi:hypothetical protein